MDNRVNLSAAAIPYVVASFGLVAAGRAVSEWLPTLGTCLAALGGVQIVFFAPGVLFVAPLLRLLSDWRRSKLRATGVVEVSCTSLLVYGGLVNLALHTVVHKAIVLLGHRVSPENYLGTLGCFALVGVAALLVLARGARVKCAQPGLALPFAAVCACLCVFVAVTDRPFLADENSYWRDSDFWYFARLRYGARPLEAAGVQMQYGREWRTVDGTKRELLGHRGTIVFHNGSGQTRNLTPKLILQNRLDVPLAVAVSVNGKALQVGDVYPERARTKLPKSADAYVMIPPRFDHKRHGRNKPVCMTMITPRLRLEPPRTVLALTVRTVSSGLDLPDGALSVYDLTNTTAAQFYQRLRRHFFFGDMGDIFETLDFARNYFDHPLQYSSCYSGWPSQPGGGYCSVSDEPPLHHFACMVALVVMGDAITSISFLFLAEVLLILLVVASLAAQGGGDLARWVALPLLGVGCAYCVLVRFGVESNAPDTLYALLLLLGIKYLALRRAAMFAAFMGLAYLTHVPTPQALLLLVLAHLAVYRDWRVLKAAAFAVVVMATVTLLRFVCIGLVSDWQTALYTGQGRFLTAGRRLSTVKSLLTHLDFAGLAKLWPSTKEYTMAVVAASCFLPLAGLLRKDKTGWFLLLFGLLYHGAMCSLDQLRAHHIGPPVFAYAAAGLRCISQARRSRPAWFTLSVVAAGIAIALCLRWGPDYTGTFSPHPLGLMTSPSATDYPYPTVIIPGPSAFPSQ